MPGVHAGCAGLHHIGPVTSLLQMLESKEKQSIDHVEPDGCEEGHPWTMIGTRTVGPRLNACWECWDLAVNEY